MARAALVLYAVSLTLTFGVRIAVQLRRTGSTGVHGLARDAGPLELLAGALLQVRLVEEPHLLRTHGEAYAAYAARVGRFVPGLGLLHGVR